jgi:hypothetical protein
MFIRIYVRADDVNYVISFGVQQCPGITDHFERDKTLAIQTITPVSE